MQHQRIVCLAKVGEKLLISSVQQLELFPNRQPWHTTGASTSAINILAHFLELPLHQKERATTYRANYFNSYGVIEACMYFFHD